MGKSKLPEKVSRDRQRKLGRVGKELLLRGYGFDPIEEAATTSMYADKIREHYIGDKRGDKYERINQKGSGNNETV